MFYDRPVYRPLGDLFVDVEFGDELHLALNFMALGLDLSLRERPIAGVTETVPSNRALMVAYDSAIVRQAALIDALREREVEATKLRRLPSRVVTIPIWYDDPWSDECAQAHGVPNNLALLAEINGTSVAEVIAAHSRTEWWVTAVGFQPGCFQALPLDPAFAISAPKYARPRQTTPERVLCLAGKITSFYPVRSPGGYQLLGRTPIDLYDHHQRNEVFRESPVLPIAGERHRYIPIDERAYVAIREQVERGDYRYQIEAGSYSLDDYLERSRPMTMEATP